LDRTSWESHAVFDATFTGDQLLLLGVLPDIIRPDATIWVRTQVLSLDLSLEGLVITLSWLGQATEFDWVATSG